MDRDEQDCGHTEEDHTEMRELVNLVRVVQTIENPRVALIVTDSGEVHFATSLPPGEAARALALMADRVRRYGGNYVHDHFDRAQASPWN